MGFVNGAGQRVADLKAGGTTGDPAGIAPRGCLVDGVGIMEARERNAKLNVEWLAASPKLA